MTRERRKKRTEHLIKHLVDTTALLTVTNPIYAGMEVGLSGMSDSVSLHSRLFAAGVSYAGLAFMYSKGRDCSQRLFGVHETRSEKVQALHDITYTAAFNLVINPCIYLANGASLKQAALGGVSSAVLSPFLGPLMGGAIDIGRDLAGLGECTRTIYPEYFKRQNPQVKKGLAALLVGASLAALAGVYALTDESKPLIQETQTANIYK